MPGFVPASGDLLQVRVVCYTDQQISLNVLHYQVTAFTGGGLNLTALAARFDDLFAASYKATIPSTAKWRGVDVQNLMAPRTLAYPSLLNDGVGTGGTTLAPTQTSYLLTLRGGMAGRNNIGHVYPGLPPTAFVTTAGGMTGGGVAALQEIADAMGPVVVLAAEAATTTLAMAIRNPDTIVAGVRVPHWQLVQQVVASQLWATQKRRGQYGAHNLPPF